MIQSFEMLSQNLKHDKFGKKTSSWKLSQRDGAICEQEFPAASHQSHQIARFLNEPADYKSLVAPNKDLKGLARRIANSSALKKVIKDSNNLFGLI
jgi:hypothetical protein